MSFKPDLDTKILHTAPPPLCISSNSSVIRFLFRNTTWIQLFERISPYFREMNSWSISADAYLKIFFDKKQNLNYCSMNYYPKKDSKRWSPFPIILRKIKLRIFLETYLRIRYHVYNHLLWTFSQWMHKVDQ